MKEPIEYRPDLTDKQREAFGYLLDNETTELLFGGQAGGAKTTLGCMWIISSALRYPKTRWLIGRAVLQRLKETTINTFLDVCGWWKLEAGLHYDYNTKDNYIKFKKQLGGSLILMKDLFSYPADPEYDKLGSLEVTGAFIDEASEVKEKAKNIVNSRIRYKLKDFCICAFPTKNSKILERNEKGIPVKWLCKGCGRITTGLLPKLLVGSNPAKNWLYSQFYIPDKEGRLPDYRKFVKASVYENPYISHHYIEALKKLDPISRSRLLEGNWEYELDEYVLIGYDEIAKIFTNKEVPQSVDWYITCDAARFGKNKCVILVWNGWRVEDYKVMAKSSIPKMVAEIEKFMSKYAITAKRVIVDEAGVGGGVVDVLKCRGFVGSASPIKVSGEKENYANLRSQCFFRFAEKVNKEEIYFKTRDIVLIATIVEELEHLKRKDPDKDGKLAIIGKDKIKEEINRSWDYVDAMAERVYFDIKKHKRFLI